MRARPDLALNLFSIAESQPEMSVPLKRLLASSLVVMAFALAGCGGASDAPELAKVTGVVMLDGKPLTKGSIQFTPDSKQGTAGRMALGEIGPDGEFTLTTSAPGDGAQVGFHTVSVVCVEATPFDPKNPQPTTVKWLIPEKYGVDQTSGLTAEIKGGEENILQFDLQSGK